MPRSARRPLREWIEDEGSDLPLHLTVLLFLLHPMGAPSIRPALLLLAVLALLHRGALRSPVLWLLLSLLCGWRVASTWPLADNHAYLLVYACLAVFLSRLAPNPTAALATSARWLVGLTFAFAVLWKAVLSPDFVDGTFFRVTLLADPRFEDLTLWIAGLTPQELEASRDFLFLPRGEAQFTIPALVEPPALHRAAAALTWGSLALEAAVAILFLAPLSTRHVWLRHSALLGFCATTYALAPVEGFGWLLLALGVGACPEGAIRLRSAYLGCYGLLLLYR